MEQALGLERDGGSAETAPGLRARVASLALKFYALAVSWRLPRRERILLRRAPAEYLAEKRPGSPLLKWLGRAEP